MLWPADPRAAPAPARARTRHEAGIVRTRMREDTLPALSITCVGFRTDHGVCRLALFGDASGFPERRDLAARVETVPIVDGLATLQWASLTPGRYALAALHDSRERGVLTRNLLGIPLDGYGVSCVTQYRLRAPTFEEAAFEVSDGEHVAVQLRMHYLL